MVIEAYLGGNGVRRREPVEGRLRSTPIGGIAASGGGVVRAAQLDDLAGRVLDDFAARDEVRVAEPHLTTGREAEELLGRVLHEVVALDPELAREGHLPTAGRGVLGVVLRVEHLDLPVAVVVDDEPEGPQDREAARGRAVEDVATACSRTPMSTTESLRDTPMVAANARMASAG